MNETNKNGEHFPLQKCFHSERQEAGSVPKSVCQLDVPLFGLIKASVSKKKKKKEKSERQERKQDVKTLLHSLLRSFQLETCSNSNQAKSAQRT